MSMSMLEETMMGRSCVQVCDRVLEAEELRRNAISKLERLAGGCDLQK